MALSRRTDELARCSDSLLALIGLVEGALVKEPTHRFASADDMIKDDRHSLLLDRSRAVTFKSCSSVSARRTVQ
jgi:hypothetical protein